MNVDVSSEIGKLKGVLLRTPGVEVERVTPENIERALYSDILSLRIAQKEYAQLKGVLDKVTQTFQVKDLLCGILENETVKEKLVREILFSESAMYLHDHLMEMSSDQLSSQLIEGVKLKNKNFSLYAKSEERYALDPLYNFYFTRDASISINSKVLIGRMANKVRNREAVIMNSIFSHSNEVKAETVYPFNSPYLRPQVSIEGGDILVAREDVLVVGCGCRTTTHGVDFIIDNCKSLQLTKHIIVQELPSKPESFIHMDMVFTFLDRDTCMLYEPLILGENQYHTYHIFIDKGEVQYIKEKKNILEALKEVGFDLKPTFCGGKENKWMQQSEQWHSGANFFAFGPGKIIGYERNTRTIENLNQNGFEVIKANDVMEGKRSLDDYEKYVVTLEASELPRGGGGARCMTMPIAREKIDW